MTTKPLTCRACGHGGLELIISLGETPLANAFLAADELDQHELTYPLEVVFCPSCALVQITETVSPEELFRNYLYFSSFSDTMLRHVETLVRSVLKMKQLGPDSRVVEIASNDGYLLQLYHAANIPVLGIEPAQNVARVAEGKGVHTITVFFDECLARELVASGQTADVIHANNVLAHVADLNGFVRGIQLLLKSDGVAIVEVPYVKDLIDRGEFDTIYHEHLCYFSLTALQRLFERHGLAIQDVERLHIHGGSLRVFLGHAGATASPAVCELMAEESERGAATFEFYQGFAARVERLKARLLSFLSELKEQQKSLAAYGAAAKGSTLLNYFQIGRETLDFVVDRNTYKQGRYMPGVRVPISAPARLLEEMPSHVLLLTWNFADEILEQQYEYRQRGGRFIFPIPELKVV